MIRQLAGIGCVLIGLAGAVPAAQSDLDALMGRVLLKRDDNWKKLQQYVLEERESMDVTALDGRKVYGFRREYQWFPRQGLFVKSPLTSDGVKLAKTSGGVRRRGGWRASSFAKSGARKSPREAAVLVPDAGKATISIGPGGVDTSFEAELRDTLEPGFVSAAYFSTSSSSKASTRWSGARSTKAATC